VTQERNTVDTPLNNFAGFLRITALLTLLAVWVFVLWLYPRLPEVIPTHFDLKGQPDDYGSKQTLFILPVVASLLWALLRFVKPRRPWPLASVRDQNAIYLFGILSTLINVLFFFILFLSYRTILHKTKGLGQWFLPISLAVFLFPTMYFLVRSLRNRDAG
jgi:hypothetical protein